jgi:hypothetical protein
VSYSTVSYNTVQYSRINEKQNQELNDECFVCLSVIGMSIDTSEYIYHIFDVLLSHTQHNIVNVFVIELKLTILQKRIFIS